MGGLLIAGGAADPNLERLVLAAREAGVPHRALRIGPDHAPRLTWALDPDALHLDGAPLRPDAVFLRYDVFTDGASSPVNARYRADAWHGTLSAWAAAHAHVRLLNRGARPCSKPEQLLLARRRGLAVPETRISSDGEVLNDRSIAGWVAKPVLGGGHCRPLAELLAETELRRGASAAPAIVQPRLPGPDLRIYGVKGSLFAFELRSDALDYRADPAVRITALPEPPAALAGPLGALAGDLGLDWFAADLKADAEGAWTFLEINNQPMFAAFDEVSDGEICRAILDSLR